MPVRIAIVPTNVAIEDVPGSLLGLDERTMAGEGVHGAPLKRDLGRRAIRPYAKQGYPPHQSWCGPVLRGAMQRAGPLAGLVNDFLSRRL